MTFYDKIKSLNWKETKNEIYSKTENDVLEALNKSGNRSLDDFKALISPAAFPHLETMAQLSQGITQKRFGKTIQLYIPLYLSNECTNGCKYCGFNHSNKIKRKTLDKQEILQEIQSIKNLGFEHILLVTGEHKSKTDFNYIKDVIELVHDHFSLVSLEIQPLNESEYLELTKFGLNTVYIYQETYHEKNYPVYHPTGKKSNFQYRLETPDRLGKAGIHKIGLGTLIGLEDWRTEALILAKHLQYLEKKYWQTKFSISFPRLRPHQGNFTPDYPINEAELVQLMTAYRLFNENIELSLSTRESAKFRNHAMKLGITTMSAGSKTEPGGYAKSTNELEQFNINDDRSPLEVCRMIQQNGYEAVWKDWSNYFQI